MLSRIIRPFENLFAVFAFEKRLILLFPCVSEPHMTVPIAESILSSERPVAFVTSVKITSTGVVPRPLKHVGINEIDEISCKRCIRRLCWIRELDFTGEPFRSSHHAIKVLLLWTRNTIRCIQRSAKLNDGCNKFQLALLVFINETLFGSQLRIESLLTIEIIPRLRL
jgi:hypothetical protein